MGVSRRPDLLAGSAIATPWTKNNPVNGSSAAPGTARGSRAGDRRPPVPNDAAFTAGQPHGAQPALTGALADIAGYSLGSGLALCMNGR
jgi:hypothetical protein